ncbi:hypothetical protein F5X99DRAFT_407769 [Biscogniauxia marginata]|nr:hypothetical protein F5X99DRAFT_407769 [Biscogniauxia marginata]
MDRLHPFDSLFRAATRRARSDNDDTPTSATNRATYRYKPYTARARAGIERWISDTRAANPPVAPATAGGISSSSATYSTLSSSDEEDKDRGDRDVKQTDDDDDDGDDDSHSNDYAVVSSPFLYATLPSSAESESGSFTGEEEEEDEEEEEEEEEQPRGRSRSRSRGLALPPLYVPIPPVLARAEACLVSPVSSGSRSSSRVSALSAVEDQYQDADWADVPIYVIPPSPADDDDDEDDHEDEGVLL